MRLKRLFAVAAAVSAAVVLGVGAGSMAGAPEGKRIFEERDCTACHQTEGPAREKTIADQLAKKGPELWYAGSKFKDGFLARWLADPQPIRPMEYYSLTERNKGDHPALPSAEAAEVAAYLMTLTSDAVRDFGISPRPTPMARRIFSKDLACYGCHQMMVRGNLRGGVTGPRLAGAAERLNPDWVYAYLKTPEVFKPVRDMPDYQGHLDEREMKGLAAFVGSLL